MLRLNDAHADNPACNLYNGAGLPGGSIPPLKAFKKNHKNTKRVLTLSISIRIIRLFEWGSVPLFSIPFAALFPMDINSFHSRSRQNRGADHASPGSLVWNGVPKITAPNVPICNFGFWA